MYSLLITRDQMIGETNLNNQFQQDLQNLLSHVDMETDTFSLLSREGAILVLFLLIAVLRPSSLGNNNSVKQRAIDPIFF